MLKGEFYSLLPVRAEVSKHERRLLTLRYLRASGIIRPLYSVELYCYETGVCQGYIKFTIIFILIAETAETFLLPENVVEQKPHGAASTVNQTAIRGLVTNTVLYSSGEPRSKSVSWVSHSTVEHLQPCPMCFYIQQFLFISLFFHTLNR